MRLVSLFAGIGGFDLGFERAGFETVATVEIDANCRKLLAGRWPKALHLDDVRTAGRHNLPDCDVLTFGFPCQDLSVAGKRAGIVDGERSSLFREALRIADELDVTWILFENVPGLLSGKQEEEDSEDTEGCGCDEDNGGRDSAEADRGGSVPTSWMGVLLAEVGKRGYAGAWRVLDAQWLGVAQRRRRVFGLFTRLDSGAGRCAEILSVAESLRGHPAPSREAGKGFTTILEVGARTGVSTTDKRVGIGIGESGDPMFTLQSGKQHAVAGTLDRKSCSSNRGGQANETDFIVQATAHTLRAEGFDASEDGTGRVTPIIPAVAGRLQERDAKGVDSDTKPGHLVPLAFDMAHGDDPARLTGDKTNTLQSRMGTGGNQVPCVSSGMAVRRLTPKECERLQGFTTNTKRCKLSVCLDHRKSVARVAVKCRKWPDNVWPVGADEKTELVNIAGSLFRNDQESRGALVAVRVRMQSEPKVAAILNQGRLCWSASGAEIINSFPLSMQPDAFAQEIATLTQCLERTADFGGAELPQSRTPSTHQNNGENVAQKCGPEKERVVKDVELTFRKDTFITFSAGQHIPPSDLTWATSFCSVLNAIASSIPSETLPESFYLVFDLEADYTSGFSDSTRYRMLGNAVCVNVAEWIAKRLAKAIMEETNGGHSDK